MGNRHRDQHKKSNREFHSVVTNGQTVKYLITTGSITFEQNGSYSLSGIVTTEDNKQLKIEYNGSIPVNDMVVPLPTTLTHGEIWYQGNIYGNNLNLYTIRLGADDVTLSTFAGTGDAMQIEIYTSIENTSGIPTGVYPVKSINDNTTNTSLTGEYNQTDNDYYGTLYFTSDVMYVNQGGITITNKGNDLYNLNFDFTDDYYGYSIIDNFDITLPIINRAGIPKLRTPFTKGKENIQKNRNGSKKVRTFERYKKSNSDKLLEITTRKQLRQK
ncbi:MAG: hypothetical protein ACK5L7_03770 [Paludibacteraceae bacterium]